MPENCSPGADGSGTATVTGRHGPSGAAALALYGVEPRRLVPRGFGPDQPVADNADEQGRQQNRRVELVRIP